MCAIRYHSPRKGTTLSGLCALPDSLFESAFFGHVKGAFAGALKDNPGRFEVADAGTLFLGEIGDVPLATYRMAETISNRGLGRGEALSIG